MSTPPEQMTTPADMATETTTGSEDVRPDSDPSMGEVEGDEQPEALFIPMGAKPDTLITADLTFAEVAEAYGVDPSSRGAVRRIRSIMGTEALPEMTSEQFLYYNEYVELWEEEPPEGYIENAMASGMNPKEFAANEKQKPAWKDTPAYADAEQQNVGALEDLLANGDQEAPEEMPV